MSKWVGNKQKQADTIIRYFPTSFDRYFEPFLGSGGVLGRPCKTPAARMNASFQG